MALYAFLRAMDAGSAAEWLGVIPVLGCTGIAEARMIVAAWALLHGLPIDAADARARVRRHGATIVLAYSLKWILMMIGLLLLLLPAVLVLILTFAVPTVTVLEGRGLLAGLRRSRRLALRRKRFLLATIVAFDMAFAALALGFTLVFGDPDTGNLPLWADATTWMLSLLVVPVRATLMAVVYAEARVRHEGYDLEAAATQLAGAT